MVWRLSRSTRTVRLHSPKKWYSGSKKLVIFSSLDHKILKHKNKYSKHGTLISSSSFCESDQCLCSSNGLVLSIRFDRRKKNESLVLWTTQFWPWWNEKWKRSYLFRTTWKQDARRRELPSIGKEDTDDTIMRKSLIPASCDSWKLLHNSTWSVHPFSQGELFLRVRRNGKPLMPTSHKEDFWQWPGGTTDWWFKTLGFIQTSIGEKVCTWRRARFQRRSLVAKRFLKAAQRRESNTGKTKMEF